MIKVITVLTDDMDMLLASVAANMQQGRITIISIEAVHNLAIVHGSMSIVVQMLSDLITKYDSPLLISIWSGQSIYECNCVYPKHWSKEDATKWLVAHKDALESSRGPLEDSFVL